MELAEPFEMTQPAISQHLKALEQAGLVSRRVEGSKRPRRLAKAGIQAIDEWLAMLRKVRDPLRVCITSSIPMFWPTPTRCTIACAANVRSIGIRFCTRG